MPARSPSASSSACPKTMPTSSTVWWAPVSRSPLASTRRPSRAWRATRSSMWSRKPTPVAESRLAAVEVERETDLGLLGAALPCRGPCHRSLLRAIADSPCTGNPSARASVSTCGARAAAAGPGKLTFAIRRRKVGGAERPGEAAGPAGREDVVGARGVVAECGRSRRADEHAAGRGHVVGERRGVLAHQLQVLRSERVGECDPRHRGRPPGRPRAARPRRSAARPPSRSTTATIGVQHRLLDRGEHQQAVGAVLRLRAEVERRPAGVGVVRRPPASAPRVPRACRSRPCRRPPASPPAPSGCRGRR